jgi:gamma-glutamyltranspeptidase/glutathione hydrolase
MHSHLRTSRRRFLAALPLLALSPSPSFAAAAEHGAAATVHPLATDAAVAALKNGGNAIDAAVAAALTLGVVDGYNSGIGGGCFMLIRLANGSVVAIDGRETAPAAATRDMYLRDGKADTRLSQTGPLASGIPGEVAACGLAMKQHGRLTLKNHLLAAAKIAEEGFAISNAYASRLASAAKDLSLFPASKAIFLRADGEPLKAGEVLKQSDLAKTYRAIAQNGIDWFYGGAFARAVADWMKQNGGLLTRDDFARYQAKLREPLRTNYRDHEIIGFPPPSSGGVHVAQILNILEAFDLKKLGANTVGFVHVVTEAMKLAFADRAYWLGDPDFAKVPRGLVDKAYARELAARIKLERATPVPAHGTPKNAASDYFGKHTTHFSTADAEGNWVACTATINTTFGSKVVVPGTGVVLNNQMDDFSAQPGVPNHFGLVGNEANAVAPGKRPLSSMSPTVVVKDGKPILGVGAAGGPTIISQTLLAILHTIEFGQTPQAALAQPRFHHQWQPDELRIESSIAKPVLAELEKRGHKLAPTSSIGVTQAVGRSLDKGVFSAAHDPRVLGKATAW